VGMAFELMQDAGLPKPKSRAEGKTICYSTLLQTYNNGSMSFSTCHSHIVAMNSVFGMDC